MTYPRVSVEAEEVDDDRAFSPDITVTEQFSDDSPAKVRIELTNTAPRNIEIGLAYVVPFDSMKGHLRDDSKVLYLIPESGTVRGDKKTDDPPKSGMSLVPDAPEDGCWRVAKPPAIRESGKLWNADPGATLQRDHAVLDEAESATCLQTGTYQFEVNWSEEPMHDLRGVFTEWQFKPAGGRTSYPWRFTVTLHDG